MVIVLKMTRESLTRISQSHLIAVGKFKFVRDRVWTKKLCRTIRGKPLCIYSHAQTVSKGLRIDSVLNIVCCFRWRTMRNKLETDVQSEPKSIMKTFISKQNEVSRGRGLVRVDVTEAWLVPGIRMKSTGENLNPDKWWTESIRHRLGIGDHREQLVYSSGALFDSEAEWWCWKIKSKINSPTTSTPGMTVVALACQVLPVSSSCKFAKPWKDFPQNGLDIDLEVSQVWTIQLARHICYWVTSNILK